METAKSLYSNIVALIAVVLAALIFAGMPLFYGIDQTIDIAVIIGLFSGTVLTLMTAVVDKRKQPVKRVARRVTT